MDDAKVSPLPFAGHFHLSSKLCPKTKEEKEFMVRSTMYAMVSTRPDIVHAVGVVRRFMRNLKKACWEEIKWILRYLEDTSNYALCFGGNKVQLQGYTDSDLVKDLDK